MSGSLINPNTPGFRYDDSSNVKHCCWPCSCDLKDALETGAVKKIRAGMHLEDGHFDFDFVAMSDFCQNPRAEIPQSAANGVSCSNGRLENAFYLDDTHVAIEPTF